MVKLPVRLSNSGTMIASLCLLAVLPLSVCAPAQPAGDLCSLSVGVTASNSTLITRADADREENWFPFDNRALALSEEQINQLSATEEQKKRLRGAKRGFQVLQAMRSPVSRPPTAYVPYVPVPGTPPGPTSNDLLRSHGWRTTGNREYDELASNGLHPAFLDLGIATGEDDWIHSVIRHQKESIDRATGKVYPPTGGEYESAFNFQDGVIVSIEAWSPDVTALKPEFRVPANLVIPLKTFSDVVFLNYRGCMSRNGVDYNLAPKIQHIFLHNPVEQGTPNFLQSVTGKKNADEVGKARHPIAIVLYMKH
ncbi:hypothetical protein CERZMDRAFT_102176 [Cercospora zeae-maydis SCOH1-5]|uniref:Uncharacterized protein n=1 Tax=Cercospora zeae-maydis SCOH1-5 TaxID=717836 RepID=A0A6A6F3F4_9PEZI|nr:hypothetical protein CERZMDRAFT_102176 [Cercospora zeae-maydis SCOH1-5]